MPARSPQQHDAGQPKLSSGFCSNALEGFDGSAREMALRG
jgi:hypothetical protein